MSDPRPALYFFDGRVLFLSKSLKAAGHRHHFVQIQIALGRPCSIDFGNGYESFHSVIIDADRFHEVDGGCDWQATVLVDAEHVSVLRFRGSSLTDGISVPEPHLVAPFIPELQACAVEADSYAQVKNLTDRLLAALSGQVEPGAESSADSDQVRQVLRFIRDLPEKKASVKDLAKHVQLSESRLMHVFKEQVGIPIRRYLLWSRLLDALTLALDGVSFSTAAHRSGFADSAHLSRTFRQTFGATLSELVRGSASEAVRIFTSPD